MDLGRWLQVLVDNSHILRRVMYVLLAGLVVADLIIPSAYDRFPWESWGGFGALYGFAACIVIIAVAKALGYLLVYRGEDYYDE